MNLPPAQPAWFDEGVCAQVDPNLWHPEAGDSGHAARKLCTGCPVRRACLEYALERGERGIWGGTSDNQRKAIRKARTPLAA